MSVPKRGGHLLKRPREHFDALLEFVLQLRNSDFVWKVGETAASRVVMIALGLVTTVVVSRILLPEGRGYFASAVVLTAIGVQFGNLGLQSANVYHVAKEPRLLSVLMGNSLVLGFGAVSVLTMVLSVVFWLQPSWAPVHGNLLVLALLGIPLGVTVMLCQNLLLGVGEIRHYNLVDVVGKAVSVVMLLFLAVWGWINPSSVYAVNVLVYVMGLVWVWLVLRPRVVGRLEWNLDVFKNHMHYGVKAYMASLFAFLVLKSDLLIVGYLRGPTETGLYSVAVNLADYVFQLPSIVGALLLPKVAARRDIREQWHITRKTVFVMMMVYGLFIAVSYLASDIVIPLFFGREFAPASLAFRWLLPGIYFLGLQVILVQFLNGRGFPVVIVFVWLGAFFVNLALNLFLIPRFGYLGASYASSLVYFSVFLVIALYILFVLKKRGREAT